MFIKMHRHGKTLQLCRLYPEERLPNLTIHLERKTARDIPTGNSLTG